MDSARVPRYELEDTSLTSTRELRGWFSYGMAAEVFAVCGIGTHEVYRTGLRQLNL